MSKKRRSRPTSNARMPGLPAVVDIVAEIAGADAAALFQALATASPETLETMTVADLAGRAGFTGDGAIERIEAAEGILSHTFTLDILRGEKIRPCPDRSVYEEPDGARRPVALAGAMKRLLEPPHAAGDFADAPRIDGATSAWTSMLADRRGDAGAVHLALRCARDGCREAEDLAALLQAAGRPSVVVKDAGGSLASALLGAALHQPPGATVIVASRCLLTIGAETNDDWFDGDGGDAGQKSGEAGLSDVIGQHVDWLRRLPHDHVWCIGAAERPAPDVTALVGACIGPMRYDPAWIGEVVERRLPGIGAEGAAMLASLHGDPRDVGALAAVAGRLAAGGVEIGEACARTVRSFGRSGSERPAPMMPEPFDPRLLVCEADALALLEHPEAAAANGARIVAWGPPGGGKSTYAQALAARIAMASKPHREVVTITPAMVLAKALGATERIMEGLFARAAAKPGAVLLVDEIDAMTGVRDVESSSGNSYLVRVMTDLWLRCLDLHPTVTVVATCNSLAAIDPAVRRRLMAFEFGDDLSPAQERLAWKVILSIEPPTGWRPCGAAVADFDAAGRRARITTNRDTTAIAASVETARRMRRGHPVVRKLPGARTLQ